ncbi:hemoglobin subunit beta-2-like [Dendrobates tinctorius]|uniref:hemoglobin subunit beta-2-like n=1 Tax=Dendrobates tinctorius TaxID=92724 RepID=UPI003CC98BBE
MEQWTAKEKTAITSVWAENPDEGWMDRLQVVLPFVLKTFKEFGNGSSSTATYDNAKVQDNSKEFIKVVGNAISHLGDTEDDLSKISSMLTLDQKEFRLFGNILIIVLASNSGSKFTPEVQDTWGKFLKTLGNS